MSRFWESSIDVVLERSPEELIGGLLVALVLALSLAGVFAMLRRKTADSTVLLAVLAIVFNLAGMLVAAGYIRETRPGARRRAAAEQTVNQVTPERVADTMIEGMCFRILVAADVDHDGRLSPIEASAAAERLIRGIEDDRKHTVDFRALADVIRQRIKPPGLHSGPQPGSTRDAAIDAH
jgi:hypothetical protein